MANSHGLGLMFHADGDLSIQRWLSYDAGFLLAQLRRCPPGVQVAVHLREATTGERGECNLHPQLASFPQQALTVAVMHNGNLRKLPAKPASGPSDTAMFVQRWLPHHLKGQPDRWRAPETLKAIEAFAGTRNRFVMLDSQGHWQVVGAHEGFEVGTTWLSNPKARAWLALESGECPQHDRA